MRPSEWSHHDKLNRPGPLLGNCLALQELGITYTQYSLLQAAVSLVNTIVPLFGGQFIDVFGTGWGSIVSSTLIMIGDMIVAFSTGIASYPVMVVGRLIYGYAAELCKA